jgi:hypothetical protein
MVWMDTAGVQALAASLRSVRESLIPATSGTQADVSGLGAAPAIGAAGEYLVAVDTVRLNLAGEIDYLQAAADKAAAAWLAAEQHNTASLSGSSRGH